MNYGSRIAAWAKSLGPGLITGASDDDPSGIGTYSIAGASTGYSMLWTALLTTPMMAVVLGVCARIGLVTGGGLMLAMGRVISRPFAVALGCLVIAANTFNLGADLAAMGATSNMLAPIPSAVWVVAFGAVILVVEIFFSYRRFARIVKWLCASLLAYVVTAFVVHPPWGTIALNTVMPQVRWNGAWLTTLVGTLGTTITPYLFFWQTSMEVEEKVAHHAARAGTTPAKVRTSTGDVNTGAIYSNVIMFFIIVTTAATLGAHGGVQIATAADAAAALRPLAGNFAYALFALGIVGTGLLAVPVLAGSSAYVATELFGFREGLSAKPKRAQGFYGTIAAGVIVGAAIALSRIDPLRVLLWAAVFNGVAAVPLLYALIVLAGDRRVLQGWTASRAAKIWLWLTFVLLALSTIGMFVSWFFPGN